MLLKKDDVISRMRPFNKASGVFRSASVLSRVKSSFTHLRSLKGLICDAGSSPINHSAKCLYFILAEQSNSPISVFLGGWDFYFQCGKVMRVPPL